LSANSQEFTVKPVQEGTRGCPQDRRLAGLV